MFYRGTFSPYRYNTQLTCYLPYNIRKFYSALSHTQFRNHGSVQPSVSLSLVTAKTFLSGKIIMQNLIVTTRVVDPDPNWIRIQQLCGSGSAFLIRIRINTGETGKRCNFFQCYYLILVTYFFLYNNFNILKHFLTFFKILKIFLGSGSTFNVFDLAPQH